MSWIWNPPKVHAPLLTAAAGVGTKGSLTCKTRWVGEKRGEEDGQKYRSYVLVQKKKGSWKEEDRLLNLRKHAQTYLKQAAVCPSLSPTSPSPEPHVSLPANRDLAATETQPQPSHLLFLFSLRLQNVGAAAAEKAVYRALQRPEPL